jgi:photosystem II stability/assembly factor-like uncharacterized protein
VAAASATTAWIVGGWDGILYGVAAVSEATAWVVGGAWDASLRRVPWSLGVLRRTADGGRSWATDVELVGTGLNGVAAASSNTGWVVGSGGRVLRTDAAAIYGLKRASEHKMWFGAPVG